jgi:hypothetical protein
MSARPWWGRVRGEDADAPLHYMTEVPDDVFRRSACRKEPGNGHVKSASPWTGEERCLDCVFLAASERRGV